MAPTVTGCEDREEEKKVRLEEGRAGCSGFPRAEKQSSFLLPPQKGGLSERA